MVSAQEVAGFADTISGKVIGRDVKVSLKRVLSGMARSRVVRRLIVQPTGAADVSATVKFARTNNLPLSVRGGGHNVAGNALCDGGVVIDLSGMRSVLVDPNRRMARAEGGATLGNVDHEPCSIVSVATCRSEGDEGGERAISH